MSQTIIEKCKKIKLLVTDVDGVLTDGGIIYDESKIETKRFNVKDGYICKYLLNSGIKLGIITGRSSKVVQHRAEELRFSHIYQGANDKLSVMKVIQQLEHVTPSEIAYIGDDLNDVDLFKYVGLSAAPNDVFDYIANEVDYVCSRKGGDGAFREFADLILKYRKNE
jgi:3-deoxy-D-manno-octulosonate 8-phosphate phosphatase (KDO 8-P phosphatase)